MKKISLNSKIKIYITFIFCVTLLFVLIAFTFNQLSPNRWQALYKIKINPEAIIYLRSTESVIIAINGMGSSPKLLELVEREMTNTAEMLNRKELRTNIKLTNDHLIVKLIDGENKNIDKITKEIVYFVNNKLRDIINSRLDLYYRISLEEFVENKKLKLAQLINFMDFIELQASIYSRKDTLDEDLKEIKKNVNFELDNVVQYFMFDEPYNPAKLNALKDVMNEKSYESLLESLRLLRWQFDNYIIPENNNLTKLQKMSNKIENLDVVKIEFLESLINRKPGIFGSLLAGGMMGLFASIALLYLHLIFPFKKLKKLLFS